MRLVVEGHAPIHAARDRMAAHAEELTTWKVDSPMKSSDEKASVHVPTHGVIVGGKVSKLVDLIVVLLDPRSKGR